MHSDRLAARSRTFFLGRTYASLSNRRDTEIHSCVASKWRFAANPVLSGIANCPRKVVGEGCIRPRFLLTDAPRRLPLYFVSSCTVRTTKRRPLARKAAKDGCGHAVATTSCTRQLRDVEAASPAGAARAPEGRHDTLGVCMYRWHIVTVQATTTVAVAMDTTGM